PAPARLSALLLEAGRLKHASDRAQPRDHVADLSRRIAVAHAAADVDDGPANPELGDVDPVRDRVLQALQVPVELLANFLQPLRLGGGDAIELVEVLDVLRAKILDRTPGALIWREVRQVAGPDEPQAEPVCAPRCS